MLQMLVLKDESRVLMTIEDADVVIIPGDILMFTVDQHPKEIFRVVQRSIILERPSDLLVGKQQIEAAIQLILERVSNDKFVELDEDKTCKQ